MSALKSRAAAARSRLATAGSWTYHAIKGLGCCKLTFIILVILSAAFIPPIVVFRHKIHRAIIKPLEALPTVQRNDVAVLYQRYVPPSLDQCTDRYHPLFQSINTSLAYWYDFQRGTSKITYDSVRTSAQRCWQRNSTDEILGECMVVQIQKSEIYLVGWHRGYQSRQQATLLMLSEVLAKYHTELYHINTVLAICSGDFPLSNYIHKALEAPSFGYSRRDFAPAFLLPEHTLIGYFEVGIDSYDKTLSEIVAVRQQAGHWMNKIDKVMFRGKDNGPQRAYLVNMTRNHSDILDIKWVTDGPEDDTHGHFVALHDHCRWKYLAVPEGWANVGRLKLLLHCNSVIAHRTTHLEHFSHLLIDNVTHISWNEKADDLPARIRELQQDPQRAAAIARRAQQVATKYLSEEATHCYVRHLLLTYHKACVDCHRFEFIGRVPLHEYMMKVAQRRYEPFMAVELLTDQIITDLDKNGQRCDYNINRCFAPWEGWLPPVNAEHKD